MRFYKFLIIAMMPVLMGTTFVIKAGDKDVGRYEEADGKNETVEMPSDQTKPAEMKKETKIEYPNDAGYSARKVETRKIVPDKKRKILLSGRILDILTLKPVSGGEVIFSADLEKHEFPVQWSGGFSGSFPRPEKTGLKVTYIPPKGYRNALWMFHSGQLAKLKPEDRRHMAEGAAFTTSLGDSTVDLEFAVAPSILPKEKKL